MTDMSANKIGWTILFLVCLSPVVGLAIWPDASLRFILTDSTWNGWLGSLYGGYVIVGLLGVIGIPVRLMRAWDQKFDWARFERTRLYAILKFIEDRFIWLFALVRKGAGAEMFCSELKGLVGTLGVNRPNPMKRGVTKFKKLTTQFFCPLIPRGWSSSV